MYPLTAGQARRAVHHHLPSPRLTRVHQRYYTILVPFASTRTSTILIIDTWASTFILHFTLFKVIAIPIWYPLLTLSHPRSRTANQPRNPNKQTPINFLPALQVPKPLLS